MNRLLFASFLAFALHSAVYAQKWEVAAQGSYVYPTRKNLGSLSTTDAKDDDTKMKAGTGYGARITMNTPGYYGFELGYVRSRTLLQTKIRPDTGGEILREARINNQFLSLNFLCYFMPPGERWRPFITGGVHVQTYGRPNIPEWATGGVRTFGGNYGGGLKIKLFPHALLRLDLRDYIGGMPYNLTFKDITAGGGIFRQLEGSVGIGISF